MIDQTFTVFCLITLALELQSCPETSAKSLNVPCPSARAAKPTGFLKNGCPKDLTQELLLPYEGICKKYYICSYGQKLPMDCPPGLHFSPDMKVCDWPARSGCQEPSPAPDARSLQLESPDQRCSRDWTAFAMFPDRRDCGKFYMCSNGVAMAMACDSGMHFNANLMICDWPSSAGCHITSAALNRNSKSEDLSEEQTEADAESKPAAAPLIEPTPGIISITTANADVVTKNRNSKSQDLSEEETEAVAESKPAAATLIEPTPTIISIATTKVDVVSDGNAEIEAVPVTCSSIHPESITQKGGKSAKLIKQRTETGKEIKIMKYCSESNPKTKALLPRLDRIGLPSTASELEDTTPTNSTTDVTTTNSDKGRVTEISSTPTNAYTESVTESMQPETTLATVSIQEESTTATAETYLKKSFKALETSTLPSTETTTDILSTLVTPSLSTNEVTTSSLTEEATSTTVQNTEQTTMELTHNLFTTFASLETETSEAANTQTTLHTTELSTETFATQNSTGMEEKTEIPSTRTAHKSGKALAFPEEKTTEMTEKTEDQQTTEASTQNEELSSTTAIFAINTESTTTEEVTTETTSLGTETLTTEVPNLKVKLKSGKSIAQAESEDLTATTIFPYTESTTMENGNVLTAASITITESLYSTTEKEPISTTENSEHYSSTNKGDTTTIGEDLYSTTAESVKNTTPLNEIESTTLSICDNCTLSAKYWAEKTNCSGYWECEAGKQVLKFCPVGLRFNAELETCDFEENVKCN